MDGVQHKRAIARWRSSSSSGACIKLVLAFGSRWPNGPHEELLARALSRSRSF